MSVRFFTTCVKIAFYSLSPESLRTMVLMRKDVLYECVKTYVMKRKEDPYAFFTPSLRTRKFNFSCCVLSFLKQTQSNKIRKILSFKQNDELKRINVRERY